MYIYIYTQTVFCHVLTRSLRSSFLRKGKTKFLALGNFEQGYLLGIPKSSQLCSYWLVTWFFAPIWFQIILACPPTMGSPKIKTKYSNIFNHALYCLFFEIGYVLFSRKICCIPAKGNQTSGISRFKFLCICGKDWLKSSVSTKWEKHITTVDLGVYMSIILC